MATVEQVTEMLRPAQKPLIEEMRQMREKATEGRQEQHEAMMKMFSNRDADKTASPAQEPSKHATEPPMKEEHRKDSMSPKLDPRIFTRVNKFCGGETGWKHWSFDFEVIVLAINPRMEN